MQSSIRVMTFESSRITFANRWDAPVEDPVASLRRPYRAGFFMRRRTWRRAADFSREGFCTKLGKKQERR
jgi:hypothetical protein